MTKLLTIAKDQLHVSDGWLLDADDNIIAVPNQHAIISQFNSLLHDMELAAYVEAQPDYCPAPSTDGFYEARHKNICFVHPDAWAEQALAAKQLENELLDAALEEVAMAEKVDKAMKKIPHLLKFCDQEEFSVPDCDEGTQGWDERILLLDGEQIMLGLEHVMQQKARCAEEPEHLCACNKKPVVEL